MGEVVVCHQLWGSWGGGRPLNVLLILCLNWGPAKEHLGSLC